MPEQPQDTGDLVEIVPDHAGDETDPPRMNEDQDDDLTDLPEGVIVDESELN